MKNKFYFIVCIYLQFTISSKAQTIVTCTFGDSVKVSLANARGNIQWQNSNDSLSWNNINGANANVLSYLPSLGIQWVRAALQEANCPEFFEVPVKIVTASLSSCANLTSVIDVDGNTYPVVTIGTQCWTKENLKTTKFSDGSVIPNIIDNSVWNTLSTPAWSIYNNNSSNEAVYGKLYNFYTVTDARNVCPIGWHVPSNIEWTVLTDYLGGDAVAGGKMKTTSGWTSPNVEATNVSGFSALPAGFRDSFTGAYIEIGGLGYWWSSTESVPSAAYYRYISYSSGQTITNDNNKRYGFSIRCLKD